MSDNNFSHAIFFSRDLEQDTPLHKSIQLRALFSHCVKEGVRTYKPLSKCADDFVRSAFSIPKGYPLLMANLFAGEVSKFKAYGFDIENLPISLPQPFFQNANRHLDDNGIKTLNLAGFSDVYRPSREEDSVRLLRTIRVTALNSIRGA